MPTTTLVASSERIYAAMVAEVYRHGYDGASLRAVAKAAGLTMSSLYHYYPSKEDILVGIMTRTLTDLRDFVAAAPAESSDPATRLAAMIRAHITFHIDRAMEAWVTDTEYKALVGTAALSIGAERDDYERQFIDTLAAGARTGALHCENPSITAKAILAMCTQVALWFRHDGPLSADDIADNYIDLVLHGIAQFRAVESDNS